uniref:casein kinase II subunit beta-1-like n=1 Tax=Erigeron canadensis TaxID=72917 RepID=UPI001CB952B4|nr:casein kinase II subunit beta-1-like [Erigeron canadensis]
MSSRPLNLNQKHHNKYTKEENAMEDSETDSKESDAGGSGGEEKSWISWFCRLRGNEFLCEVDEDYIQDDFNLCGLSKLVPDYDNALDLILDIESSDDDKVSEKQVEDIESAAEMLYGLIHARFILTTNGLGAMLKKYKLSEFGYCPRTYCCAECCLPIGQSDHCGQSNVKLYCPRCHDIYNPGSKFQDKLDGAYFGSTFPHLFLLTYKHLKRENTPLDNPKYVPRVFGYKVHNP